jgi:hypothetical protein
MEQWVAAQPATPRATPALQEALTALRAVLTQDLEPDPTTGRRRILRGVAKGRQPSLGDPEMRHGVEPDRWSSFQAHTARPVATRDGRSTHGSDGDLAVGHLANAPQYCRATADRMRPDFGKLVSSRTKIPVRSGITARRRRRITSASHGACVMKC